MDVLLVELFGRFVLFDGASTGETASEEGVLLAEALASTAGRHLRTLSW
jgi:hypothetical protein